MKKNEILGVIAIFLCIYICVSAFAATITFKSGKEVEGEIIERSQDFIKIDFLGMPVTYYYDEIESIDGEPVTAPELSPQEDINITEDSPELSEQVDAAVFQIDLEPEAIEEIEEVPTQNQDEAKQSIKEALDNYVEALNNKNLENIKQYSPEKIAEKLETENKVKLGMMLNLTALLLPDDILIGEIAIKGNSAEAEFEGDEGQDGSAKLLSEAGTWKVLSITITGSSSEETIDGVPVSSSSSTTISFAEDLEIEEESDASMETSEESDSSSIDSDSLWKEDLSGVAIPDTTAQGLIHGNKFTLEKAELKGSILYLKQGKEFFADLELIIFLSKESEESFENKKYDVSIDQGFGSPHIHMKWKEEDADVPTSKIFMKDYAMRLEFGEKEDEKLAGKIYICLPDEDKSYVAGSFSVKVE